ncbi:tetratricopeptide repeat-containing protein [Trifolium pratense]|uniref:Tetratricopeptide repeat-containing protein n=1 Tax=Trifolium pratense TaxID=57577 RepID=A0A2K3NG18_TRIPR|nr:tetratricopeptide repeat-containing protein [Trifolium pratense]
MLLKIQMIQKSPYGAIYVKLNYMEWMKQGSDISRHVGRDPRPVMRETYNMFKDGGDPEKLVAAFSNSRESDYFYASLYAGLYYESQKENDAAKVHIVAACKSSYGQRSDDYMASLSKVHCLCRNWNLS